MKFQAPLLIKALATQLYKNRSRHLENNISFLYSIEQNRCFYAFSCITFFSVPHNLNTFQSSQSILPRDILNLPTPPWNHHHDVHLWKLCTVVFRCLVAISTEGRVVIKLYCFKTMKKTDYTICKNQACMFYYFGQFLEEDTIP